MQGLACILKAFVEFGRSFRKAGLSPVDDSVGLDIAAFLEASRELPCRSLDPISRQCLFVITNQPSLLPLFPPLSLFFVASPFLCSLK